MRCRVFYFMPLRFYYSSALLSVALTLFSGCVATTRQGDSGREASKKAVGSADYSEAAVKARTQSHAHYSAAILHEINDEPEKAADEFYRAAFADPTNEALLLEASNSLLRNRQAEKRAARSTRDLVLPMP
jgi:hypothetical protein